MSLSGERSHIRKKRKKEKAQTGARRLRRERKKSSEAKSDYRQYAHKHEHTR